MIDLLDTNTCIAFLRVVPTRESAGRRIGANDLLSAAVASARNPTLVRHNVREFVRVPRLRIEDWLAP